MPFSIIEKEMMIERAHRTKRNYKDKDKKRPRTIVLRLTNFKEKSIILKNVNKVKRSDVYINEDFSRETTELRKKMWKEVKQLLSEGNFTYFNYRTIITRGQGKKQFDQIINFYKLIAQMAPEANFEDMSFKPFSYSK